MKGNFPISHCLEALFSNYDIPPCISSRPSKSLKKLLGSQETLNLMTYNFSSWFPQKNLRKLTWFSDPRSLKKLLQKCLRARNVPNFSRLRQFDHELIFSPTTTVLVSQYPTCDFYRKILKWSFSRISLVQISFSDIRTGHEKGNEFFTFIFTDFRTFLPEVLFKIYISWISYKSIETN